MASHGDVRGAPARLQRRRQRTGELGRLRGQLVSAHRRELREFRSDSKDQHERMQEKLDAAIRDGESGRNALHEKVNKVGKVVSRLVGYHEARSELKGAE